MKEIGFCFDRHSGDTIGTIYLGKECETKYCQHPKGVATHALSTHCGSSNTICGIVIVGSRPRGTLKFVNVHHVVDVGLIFRLLL